MQHVICVTDVLSLITLFIPLGDSLNLVSPLTQPRGTLARFHKIHFKYPSGKESIKNVQKGEELTLVFGFTGELNNTGRYPSVRWFAQIFGRKTWCFIFLFCFISHTTKKWMIHHSPSFAWGKCKLPWTLDQCNEMKDSAVPCRG